MSIASEIARIKAAKEAVRTAINAKGAVIPESAHLSDYSGYFDSAFNTSGRPVYYPETVPAGVSCSPELYALYAGLKSSRDTLASSMVDGGMVVPSGTKLSQFPQIISAWSPAGATVPTEYSWNHAALDISGSFPDRTYPGWSSGNQSSHVRMQDAIPDALSASDDWEVYMRCGPISWASDEFAGYDSAGNRVFWIAPFCASVDGQIKSYLRVLFKDTQGNTVAYYNGDSALSIPSFSSEFNEFRYGLQNNTLSVSYRPAGGTWSFLLQVPCPDRVDWGSTLYFPESWMYSYFIDRCYIRSGSRWLWSFMGQAYVPGDVPLNGAG